MQVFKQNYFGNNICPLLVNSLHKDDIKSRIILWIAYANNANNKNQGEYTCPIRMYKHSTQFIYNRGKGGLYQGSECKQMVR